MRYLVFHYREDILNPFLRTTESNTGEKMEDQRVGTSLFRETFSFRTEENLPGSWYVERNSELNVPAIRCGEKCIEFLSAGNKFLPVIPDVENVVVRFTASMNFEAAKSIGFTLFFHYDTFTGRGKALRFTMKDGQAPSVLFGTTARNLFQTEQSGALALSREVFLKDFDCELRVVDGKVTFTLAGESISFATEKGSGKVAFSREHFFDVLFMKKFEIDGSPLQTSLKTSSFTVPLPDTLTYYPIFCDVLLSDYGNCMDAKLSFRGGVCETPLGEGNYHGLRADILTRPYLKVLNGNAVRKFILFDDPIVLAPYDQKNPFLYTLIYDKPQWPFERTIRFIKEGNNVDFAVGFDEYHHNGSPMMELAPAETVFDGNGSVLDCGLGLTGNGLRRMELLSRKDKEIISRLPATDPRYERAVKFAENNHYFFEGEKKDFAIRITACNDLPLSYEVTLEDTFLRKVRTLEYTRESGEFLCGSVPMQRVTLRLEEVDLPCGVWHIRIRSTDESVHALEEYWAFEVMSRDPAAPCAPLLSKLPFLYNARTETRGLMTDSFDPWLGAQSVDEGHYVSCAVMLPEAFRKYDMGPTLHAYGRKNFSWISTRTLDHPEIEDNLDVIAKSDYVNVQDRASRMSFLWHYTYAGERLRWLIDFLKTRNDPYFDLADLEAKLEKGESITKAQYEHLARHHWYDWLDYANACTRQWGESTLKRLREVNPDVLLSQYGPFHIYAARLKGPECVYQVGNANLADLTAFWQFEDYPYSCGYGLERGLYCLTSCLLALPGARIYPEIYTGGKLGGGCPDGAVFYAHPPFGGGVSKFSKNSVRKVRSEKLFGRQIANLVYGSGHLTENGFRFWTERGFQSMRFTRKWFEQLLRFWPNVMEHAPERPLCSAAYISSDASRRANANILVNKEYPSLWDVHCTATEDVPAIYEEAFRYGLCAGFQMWDTQLDILSAEQTDTLVLPPLRGMAPETLKEIRRLHEEGVNLVACENVDGLEDLFGVEDTRERKTITLVRGSGNFCNGMEEFCDEGDLCCGSYKAVDCEVLLSAEIPVLTLKKNAKASAAFFNVPPHHVKIERLHQRLSYGKGSISTLMAQAVGQLMKRFSRTGISISCGTLLGAYTQDHGIMIIVSNPDDDHEISSSITLEKGRGFDGTPVCNRPVRFLKEDATSRTCRVLLPPGEMLTMFFPGETSGK